MLPFATLKFSAAWQITNSFTQICLVDWWRPVNIGFLLFFICECMCLHPCVCVCVCLHIASIVLPPFRWFCSPGWVCGVDSSTTSLWGSLVKSSGWCSAVGSTCTSASQVQQRKGNDRKVRVSNFGICRCQFTLLNCKLEPNVHLISQHGKSEVLSVSYFSFR